MQQTIPLDYVIKILGIFFSILIVLLGVIGGFVKMLHNDMKKAIESIHDDLKPLLIDVAQLKTEVINIKIDHKELKETVNEHVKWVGQHDMEIQSIKRQLKTQ